MTREITLRIYDKLNKVMWHPENIAALDFESKCAWIKQPYKSGHWVYFKNAEILEFTGLYDKSNSPIYEGDVLSTDLSRPYLVVEFRNGAFMFQCHHNGQDYYDFMTSAYENSNFTKYHEVIGNIHEHRHLLGGVDE